jgi:hypothetical protein
MCCGHQECFPASAFGLHYLGPEFSLENEGKLAIIHIDLFGGKSAGRNVRNHLRSCMHYIGSRCCPADPDALMRSVINSDGTEVHEYAFLYTDDALSIGVEPISILRKEIGQS